MCRLCVVEVMKMEMAGSDGEILGFFCREW